MKASTSMVIVVVLGLIFLVWVCIFSYNHPTVLDTCLQQKIEKKQDKDDDFLFDLTDPTSPLSPMNPLSPMYNG